MATLTDVARVTRISVNAFIGLIVFLIVGRVFLNVSTAIYKQLNPAPPPAPTMGFGALPPIVFPEKTQPNLQLRLETVGDQIPNFGVMSRVYLITFARSGFLDLDRSKKQAASLGFVFEPEEINPTIHRWTRTTPLQSTLDLDTVSNSFTMEVSWETDPNFLNSRLLPNPTQAISEAKAYLKNGGFLAPDLESGETTTTFLQYRGGDLRPSVSQSEADFIKVDMYRQSLDPAIVLTADTKNQAYNTGLLTADSLRILPADPTKGLGEIIISGSRESGTRVVSATYNYTTVDYEQFHTYPIITGSQAWEMLNNGQGFIAQVPEVGDIAVIRQISFGFYDSLDKQQYLQPIYIFQGDDGFTAYVPAVAPWAMQGYQEEK